MLNKKNRENREYFLASHLIDENFYQFPKWLMDDPELSHLTNDAKVLYMLLKDRFKLSLKNNWIDKEGKVFVVCTIKTMEELLHKSNKTVIKIKDELVKADLIEDVQNGKNKPNYIYLLMPKLNKKSEANFEEDSRKDDLNEDDSWMCNNYISGNVSSSLPEVKDLHSNKNNSIKNNYSKYDVVEWINDRIDASNFSTKELNELNFKKSEDKKTLLQYKKASFDVAFCLKSWAEEKFRNDIIYKYELPKDSYLCDNPPTSRAEHLVLDTLCLNRYNKINIEDISERELNRLFLEALDIVEPKNNDRFIRKTSEAYFVGVVDNVLKVNN